MGLSYLSVSGNIALKEILVPLQKTSFNPYSLFSGRHLLDLLNLFLLNFPLLLLILIVSSLRKKFIAPFYLIMIGPSLLFTILVDPKLGAYRDWDLLSIASAPIIAFAVSALANVKCREYSKPYSIYIIIGLFGFIHTGSWIVQNTSQEKSYTIVKDQVKADIHYSREYKLGYGNKSWALLANRYAKDSDELIRALFERYYGDPNDFYNTCQLAEALEVLGHYDQAVEITKQNWEKFKGEAYSAIKLSTAMMNIGRLSEAEQICQGFLSTGKEDTLIYYNLANIKRFESQIDSFYYYLDKSYSININKSPDMLLNFYLNCFTKGHDKLAASGINRITPGLTGSQKMFAAGILDILTNGSKAGIDSLRTGLAKSMKMSASP